MARKRISEAAAKQIFLQALAQPSNFHSLTSASKSAILGEIPPGKYVVKVDQGVKKRGKLGLLKVGLEPVEIGEFITELEDKGYTNFFVEPVLEHAQGEEKYLSAERVRAGWRLLYSNTGGVDVEDSAAAMKQLFVPFATDYAGTSEIDTVTAELELPDANFVSKLLQTADGKHVSFLEINPLVVKDNRVHLLDLAVEVDSVGEFFVENAWTSADFVNFTSKAKASEVEAIENLDRKSQASLKIEMLNPDGKLWMLLSGGGASIVLADEAHNLGFGGEIANYGEYSGNPNSEETYTYTKNILQLLVASKTTPKALIIAGGVANFTDVRITFNGVLRALGEFEQQLKEQRVKVFVRRGGPHAEEGLAKMRAYLEGADLIGSVHGPELPLNEIVAKSLEYLNNA